LPNSFQLKKDNLLIFGLSQNLMSIWVKVCNVVMVGEGAKVSNKNIVSWDFLAT